MGRELWTLRCGVDQVVSWTEKEIRELRRHCAKGTLFLSEIAELMGRNRSTVQYMAKKLGIYKAQKKRYGEWNVKHAHLRKAVMTYFLDHSCEETRKEFKLTQSELKSLMTVAYRDPSLAHLRKDTRRKDPWTLEETLFVLKHSGVMPREWIAGRLGRSGARNLKERMAKWNAGTKWLNGMPFAWAKALWPEAQPKSIKTEAGPSHFKFRIVTWHDALDLSKTYKTPPEIKSCLRSMVRFQEFIHQTQSRAAIKRRFTKALSQEK